MERQADGRRGRREENSRHQQRLRGQGRSERLLDHSLGLARPGILGSVRRARVEGRDDQIVRRNGGQGARRSTGAIKVAREAGRQDLVSFRSRPRGSGLEARFLHQSSPQIQPATRLRLPELFGLRSQHSEPKLYVLRADFV